MRWLETVVSRRRFLFHRLAVAGAAGVAGVFQVRAVFVVFGDLSQRGNEMLAHTGRRYLQRYPNLRLRTISRLQKLDSRSEGYLLGSQATDARLDEKCS